MQFNNFVIISPWEFSVAMASKPRGRLADFLLFSIALYPFNICTKLESSFFSGFGGEVFFFLNLMLPWKPNKMATDHETHKLGR